MSNTKWMIGGAAVAAAAIAGLLMMTPREKPPEPAATVTDKGPEPEPPQVKTSTVQAPAHATATTTVTTPPVPEREPGVPANAGVGVVPNGLGDVDVVIERCKKDESPKAKEKLICTKESVPATLTVSDKHGKVAEVEKLSTRFPYRFDLPVGEYQVVAKTKEGQQSKPVSFKLEPGKGTRVEIKLEAR